MANIYYGMARNSLVAGTSGNDSIYHGDGITSINLTIIAGAGNDTVGVSGSSITVDAGDGNNYVDFFSGGSNRSVKTGDGMNTVSNYRANDVTIVTGAGRDSIKNDGSDSYSGYQGMNATVDAGAGNDTIFNLSYHNAIINAGAGNDIIRYDSGNNGTINGGAGNDSIKMGASRSKNTLIIYNEGDGNDTIEGFNSTSTLQIGGGYGTYHKETVDYDVILTVGEGKITLVNMAYSDPYIEGVESELPAWRLNGTTATYGTSTNAQITISGVKSLDGISLSGNVVTLVNSALNKSNVTINNGYYLALDSNVTAPSYTNENWTMSGDTAIYNGASNTAGYVLANNQISYVTAKSGDNFTLSGVKGTGGLAVAGNVVTVSNSSLKQSTVTISNNDYTLALGNNVTKTSTTAAGWSLSDTTATYKTAATSAGYKLANNKISYVNASGGESFQVSGVKSLDGISLSGTTVTVGNSSLNQGKVSISDGYTLALADDVTQSQTTAGSWSLNDTTATYKSASNTTGYKLENNQISYVTASGGNTLTTVNGVKSTGGLSINTTDKTVTVGNSALNQGTVSISEGYTLKLADDVTQSQTTAAGWSLNGTTATYKATATSAGYKLANNQISYVTASGGETLITVSGVKSLDGISLNGSAVTVANSSLNQDIVTISDGYTLKLDDDVPISSIIAAGWSISGLTATYKDTATKAGYQLINDAIIYTAASGGSNVVTVDGVISTSGLSINTTDKTVTVSNSALYQRAVTISDGYTFALADDVTQSTTTAASWSLNGTTATYKTAAISEGYKLANNQISYVTASGGESFQVSGVKSLDGITLNGSTVTVANSSLNQGTVAISDGYTLALADDVTQSTTTEAGWSLSGTTATYKAAATSAGYKLANNQISYVTASGGETLIKVTNIKSLDGISLSGNVVTIDKAAVNAKKITLTGDGYTLALTDDVTKRETKKAAWSYSNGTATYKGSYKTKGYLLASNAKSISYSKATTASTLATVKGVKSKSGLSLSDKVITVAKAAVNAKKITLTGSGYTLALADNVKKRETKPAAWSYSGGTATYKSSYKTAGYLLASNAKSISYYSTATTASTLASVKGAVSKTGLSVSDKKFTLKASALSKKVTISGSGYEFDFASDYKNATIVGSAKADSISARGSKVSINAGKGDDTITMRGTTSITGGAGADIFVYKAGKHVIRDYKEEDTISITGAAEVTTSGRNVIFTIGSGKITVTGGKDKTISYIDEAGEHTYPEPDNNGIKFNDKTKTITLTENYSEDDFDLMNYDNKYQTVDASAVQYGLKITGNKLKNLIIGTEDDDTINGGAGVDIITGGAGNDSLFGGKGNDTLTGGNGADVFVWNNGDGNDLITDGNDLITDYTDEDTILINGDTVKTKKASGDNLIFTLAGKNKITVQGGAYKIIDYIDDTGEHIYSHFVTYNDAGTSAKLKAGYSKKSFEPSDYAKYVDDLKTINASAVLRSMSIAGNDIANSITGTADEDYINGGAGKDTIRGGDGNDSLLGGAGNDYLYGGEGNDTLWGGTGSDYLYGGEGEDVFLYKPGEGKDRIYDYNPAFDTIKLLSGTVDNVESAETDIVFTIGTGKIILDNAAGSYAKVVDSNGNTLKEYLPKTRS